MPSAADLGIQAKSLKAARERRKWSQARLAAALEQAARTLDQENDLPPGGRKTLIQYISYFENGRRPVPERLMQIFYEAFQTTDEELHLAKHTLLAVATEPPALPADHIRSSGLAIVTSLEQTLNANVQADALIGPAYLLPGVHAQIPVIDQVCRATRGADHQKALRLGSRFMQFCGWLFQDSGDYVNAMQLTDRSLEYAMELDDRRLISYVLMRKSNIATESGHGGHGLGLANAALQQRPSLTPRLRAVSLRQRANADAILKDLPSFAQDTEDALAQAVLGETQGEEDLASYCTPSYVEMEAGASWLKLDAPESAVGIFEASRTQWNAVKQTRDQALCLARLATAYAAAGEPRLACATGGELAAVASGLTSTRVTGQIATLRTSLSPWRKDGDVADLLYKLRAFN